MAARVLSTTKAESFPNLLVEIGDDGKEPRTYEVPLGSPDIPQDQVDANLEALVNRYVQETA